MLLTRYAPFRRSPSESIATPYAAPRLACVKPAASVHPEPGSNSSLYISISLSLSGLELTSCFACLYFPVFSNNFKFCFSRAPAASVCGRSFPHYRKVTAEPRALTSLHLLRDIPGCLTDTLISPGHLPVRNSNNLLPETPFSFGDCKGTLFLFPSKLFFIFFRGIFRASHSSF